MMNLGFMVSGQGSNMQAIIDACKSGVLDAKPVVVISNNACAPALDKARAEDIPAFHLGSETHPDQESLYGEITRVLQHHDVQLVVLAGYMKKICVPLLTEYKDRIINIHPSLLPDFGGRGMYGLRVHKAVLDAGKKETGVTIHLVDDRYDSGKVLAQAKVPVEPGDTPESLAARVLKVEHKIYVKVLQDIVNGNITLPGITST